MNIHFKSGVSTTNLGSWVSDWIWYCFVLRGRITRMLSLARDKESFNSEKGNFFRYHKEEQKRQDTFGHNNRRINTGICQEGT